MRRTYVHRPGHPKANDCGMVAVEDLGETQGAEPRLQVMTDSHYQGVRSPIDGTPLESRTAHRQYMKANGLVLADDFKSTWAEAAKKREEFRRTGEDGIDWGRRLAEGLVQRQARRRR